jgi:hypothetical protein
MSVHRSKFCRAENVLRGHKGWGVVQVRVRDVPTTVACDGRTYYATKPVHVPLDGSHEYPHSEIQALDSSGKRVPNPQYKAEADMMWREALRRGFKSKIAPDGTA